MKGLALMAAVAVLSGCAAEPDPQDPDLPPRLITSASLLELGENEGLRVDLRDESRVVVFAADEDPLDAARVELVLPNGVAISLARWLSGWGLQHLAGTTSFALSGPAGAGARDAFELDDGLRSLAAACDCPIAFMEFADVSLCYFACALACYPMGPPWLGGMPALAPLVPPSPSDVGPSPLPDPPRDDQGPAAPSPDGGGDLGGWGDGSPSAPEETTPNPDAPASGGSSSGSSSGSGSGASGSGPSGSSSGGSAPSPSGGRPATPSQPGH